MSSPTTKKSTPTRPRPAWSWQRRLLSYVLIGLAALGLAGILTVAGFYFYFSSTLPSVAVLKDIHLQVPLRVYTRDGKLMAMYGDKLRIPLNYGQIPPLMAEAFIAAEDDRFFDHPGLDLRSLSRAGISLLVTGSKSQGGSTITMQLARNFFLSPKKLFSRKIREIVLAMRIEHELSKEDILSLYLNKIYLGNHAYGVGAAAEVYYGKDVWQLDLAQIAMIAGLPQAPSTHNPVVDPKGALERRAYVLQRMQDLGYIDQASYKLAMAQPVTASRHTAQVTVQAPYVGEMVRSYMVGHYGEAAYTAGYRVTTTIDSRLELQARTAVNWNLERFDHAHGWRGPVREVKLSAGAGDAALNRALAGLHQVENLVPGVVTAVGDKSAGVFLAKYGEVKIDWPGLQWASGGHSTASGFLKRGDVVYASLGEKEDWQLAQIPRIQGALVALDPYDGAIVALDGGFAFGQSNFNRAIQAHRQLGSSFKPFVYSAALHYGMTPASLVSNAPLVTVANPALANLWRPGNYEGETSGMMRLREGLVHSVNIVSIRVLEHTGLHRTLDWTRRFGFDPDELPHNLTLALGSASLTPLAMARGYAVFANGGFLVRPYFIQRIEGPGGNEVAVAHPWIACAQCATDGAISTIAADAPVASSAPDEPQKIAAPAATARSVVAAAGAVVHSNVLADRAPRATRLAPRTISAQNAYLMMSMLQSVIARGTGRPARVLGRDDLGGKTGTTNDFSNAWFDGFSPRLVTVTWVGYDQPRTLGKGETGARAALPMWIKFMGAALDKVPQNPWSMPAGIVTARIDSQTGLRCPPGDPNAMWEVFQEGKVPPLSQAQQLPSLYGGGQ